MSKNRLGPYSFGIAALLLISAMTPVFAEVATIQTNSEQFFKGDKIKFSGTVDKGSKGLVTIVIRDIDDKFITLEQAVINPDYTFERTVPIDDKFSEHGLYGVNGFILSLEKGAETTFVVSLDGSLIDIDGKSELSIPEIDEKKPINVSESHIEVDFIDESKDPQHYIDRYYNETTYQEWFDRNYPGITIEEAVGYETSLTSDRGTPLIKPEIIPSAEASSVVSVPITKENSNIAEISLVIASIGILFGAVYGVKRKVDHNSKQISLNRNIIQKKIIRPLIGNDPQSILKTRLAKGEITLQEYEQLKFKIS